LTVAGRLVFE